MSPQRVTRVTLEAVISGFRSSVRTAGDDVTVLQGKADKFPRGRYNATLGVTTRAFYDYYFARNISKISPNASSLGCRHIDRLIGGVHWRALSGMARRVARGARCQA